jgi:hypothetical protein
MKIKKGDKKKSKLFMAIIALVVIGLLVGGYFGFKAYKSNKDERDLEIFQQGFSYGYTSAVLQIMNVSDACQPFPVYVGNETRTLISIDCLSFE